MTTLDTQSAPPVPADFNDVLNEAVSLGASDVMVRKGSPPLMRLNSAWQPMDYQKLTPLDVNTILANLWAVATADAAYARLRKLHHADFRSASGEAYFRISAALEDSYAFLVCRPISIRVPTLDDLEFLDPDIRTTLRKMADRPRGLLLVTGPTGSGKSTTLAAIIQHINSRKPHHIITIEDPVEFMHKPLKGIVNQREVGTDTPDFASALRAALRQAPDVILVGELRDAETLKVAMQAADTGHLVLGTLHTNDAVSTIGRILALYGPEEQEFARNQVSQTIVGIVSQQLVPRMRPACSGRGRQLVCEVLVPNDGLRNALRTATNDNALRDAVRGTTKDGGRLMDTELQRAAETDVIGAAEAVRYAIDAREMRKTLRVAED